MVSQIRESIWPESDLTTSGKVAGGGIRGREVSKVFQILSICRCCQKQV